MMRPRILLTVPTGDAWIHKHVVRVVVRCLQDTRFNITYMDPTWIPYENNLNHCAAQVVDERYDYWLSIDADNPPSGNPLDRVCDDLDLVGFPTPVYHDAVAGDRPWYFNALDEVEGGWQPHAQCVGLQRVDAVGSGCFLVAARVLRAVPSPWFMREYNARGFVERGHDFLFAQKVRQHGFAVWADFTCVCQHFQELDLLSVIHAFAAMKERHG